MELRSIRSIVNTFIFRAISLIVVVAFLSNSNWLEQLDWIIYDKAISLQTLRPDSDIVIVAIDEESLQMIGRWPWSRKWHAKLINRLSQSGWNVVALDLLLSEPDDGDPDADNRLAAAISAHGNVILPVAPIRVPSEYALSLIQPLASLQRYATLGHADIELDRDGVARRVFLYAGIDTPLLPALGLALANKSSLTSEVNVLARAPVREKMVVGSGDSWVRSQEVLIPFTGPPGSYQRISYARLLEDDVMLASLRDKIIIIGMTATGLQPSFSTPVSLAHHHHMSGAEWHANVVDMLRSGRSIYPASDIVTTIGVVLWVLTALIAVSVIPKKFAGLSLVVLFAVGVILVGISLRVFHVWLPPGAGIVGLLAVYPLLNWQRINEFIHSQFITRTYLQAVFESVREGVITTDARHRILYINGESERILGVKALQLIGKPLDQVIEVDHLIVNHYNRSSANSEPAGVRSHSRMRHCVLKAPLGDDRTVRVAYRPLYGKQGALMGAVITIFDISDTLEMKQRIIHQAHYDTLTMLPNRTFLLSRLDTLVDAARQNGSILTICFVSIDNFKKINDALGYRAGDTLLKMVAERLLKIASREDLTARWSGDEFVLASGQLSQESQVLRFAQKILDTMSRRFEIDGQDVFLSASVGISISTRMSENCETVLDQAAIAMQRVKQQGGNNFQFYSSGRPDIWTREQLELEKDFRLAIENKGLHVLFQPIVDVRQQRIARTEALVRWTHPKRGVLLPGEFIPLAERVGLVERLGELVLRIACSAASDLAKVGRPIDISVNVAPRQLMHADFLRVIAEVLEGTTLPAERLVLEITESAIISDLPRAAEVLVRLKELGITIALDDFGTGYSSLSLLRELPIDILKIDKSFIRSIGHGNSSNEKFDFAITQAIIGLGGNLGLTVIAEGVETAQHMELLRTHHCYLQQGYYFSHPLSTTQLMQFIGKYDTTQTRALIKVPAGVENQ
jgi:diguanylate cyclase (GGDEF)-like protein/PAS domain S-box-containing protein